MTRHRPPAGAVAWALLLPGGIAAAQPAGDGPPETAPPRSGLPSSPMALQAAPMAFGGAPLDLGGGAFTLPGAAQASPASAMPSPAAMPLPGAADEPPAALPAGAALPTSGLALSGAGFSFADSHVAVASTPLQAGGAPLLPGGMSLREEGGALCFTLGADLRFDFDRAELRREAGPMLRRLVEEVAARLPGRAALFRVEGHTDRVGSDSYNLRLSDRRAASVRAWLTREGGVAARAVATAGYGESRPVAPNARPDGSDDPGGRQRNRRVEVLVTPR